MFNQGWRQGRARGGYSPRRNMLPPSEGTKTILSDIFGSNSTLKPYFSPPVKKIQPPSSENSWHHPCVQKNRCFKSSEVLWRVTRHHMEVDSSAMVSICYFSRTAYLFLLKVTRDNSYYEKYRGWGYQIYLVEERQKFRATALPVHCLMTFFEKSFSLYTCTPNFSDFKP